MPTEFLNSIGMVKMFFRVFSMKYSLLVIFCSQIAEKLAVKQVQVYHLRQTF